MLHALVIDGEMTDFSGAMPAGGPEATGVAAGSWLRGSGEAPSCRLSCRHGSCLTTGDGGETCLCQNDHSGRLTTLGKSLKLFLDV